MAEDASWEGNLTSYYYNTSQCQMPIANGTTTKIFKLDIDDSKLPNDISFFCETDIIGNASVYTKVVYSGCNTQDEGSISFNFISCNDALCSTCEDDWSPEFTGYMTFNTARTLYNNVGSCFEYVGVTIDEEQTADSAVGDILSDTNSTAEATMVPSVFQTFGTDTDLDILQSYWNVMFDNSCVFSDAEVKSFITNSESEVNWSERSVVDKEEEDGSTTNSTQEEVLGDWNGNEKVSSAVSFGTDRVVVSLALSFVFMIVCY